MDLSLISRSRFKQLKIPPLIPRSYVVGYFVIFVFGEFWVYLGRYIFFKGLVKFRKIGNIEDLMKV